MSKEIPLTRGHVAIVDDEDYEWLSQFKWQSVARGDLFYAQRTVREEGVKKGILMHRELVNPANGLWVDHINRNTLDNRRENLRSVTQSQNQMNLIRKNRTGFKGVGYDTSMVRIKRFRAVIKSKTIGRFHTAEEAARAYDAAAREQFGEYARLNFPEEA